MNKSAIHIAILYIALLLVQVLICNHIVLFNVAVPLVFIYFILRCPVNMNTNLLLTLSFAMGFMIDISCDTLGVNSLSCTVLAILKKPLFYAYVQHDDRAGEVIPSISNLGIMTYSKYLLSATAIYCLMVFSLEYFSIEAIQDILISAASSALLTFCVLLGLDSIIGNKNEKRL